MVESYNSKRVKFNKGQQNRFINNAAVKLKLDNKKLAKLLKVSVRTITDWKREKFLMSLSAAQKLSKMSGTPLPKNMKIRDMFWHVRKGAYRGGLTSFKKQGGIIGGDPQYRKKKWREWWEKEGKFKDFEIFRPLPFRTPEKSDNLAEFVGIMMGDGGLNRKQVMVTLHHIDDLEYSKFVVKLMRKLFAVSPSIYRRPEYSVNNIVISRSGLVQHLHKLGLPIGNKIKQQIDIPPWILHRKDFQVACVRGLVDTDGSVFTHRYKVNGKWYSYRKLAFTSKSPLLIQSVYNVMRRKRLRPRIAQQGRDVRLDSAQDMKRYFMVFGSHNPKHLKRYRQ